MRALSLLAMSVVFMVVGGMMIVDHDGLGWFVAGLFGLMIFVFLALSLWPGQLVLTPDAFIINNLRGKSTWRWQGIEQFGIMRIYFRGFASKRVGFRFKHGGHSALRKLSIGLTGFDGALPDTYGLSAERLVAIMEDVRRADHQKSPVRLTTRGPAA